MLLLMILYWSRGWKPLMILRWPTLVCVWCNGTQDIWAQKLWRFHYFPIWSQWQKSPNCGNMTTERSSHLLKSLPKTISELRGSRDFFLTTGIDNSFLDIPVDNGPFTKSFKEATAMANHIVCINNCAERGIALTQTFNATNKHEEQLQYLLQVVEQHREIFPKYERDYLQNM